jgi:hypothetical protein
MVNPIGTQFAHLASGRGSKLEWEGVWKSAAKIVSDGWTAEMAIPWSILNYPVSKGTVMCDLNFDRFQQRTKIHSWWSNVGQKEQYELDGTWTNVQFPPFKRRFSLLPYAAPDWSQKDGGEFRSGLDIRGALSPSMTLVGTVNPDFKNIEQAVEGIDFSYGERFVPDQRPFFQEGANFYQSGGVAGNYVYTPRIQDFDTGINLYGKVDPKNSVGLLGAFDFGNRADWILRSRHVLATNFSVDTALINRDESGNHNRVFGAGENFRKGLWGLDASSFGSWENGKRLGNASNAFFYYQSPRWYNQIAAYTISPKFRDDLGFIPFTDYRGFNGDFNYNREWRKGPFQSLGLEFFAQRDEHFDGSRYRNQKGFWSGLTNRQDTRFIFSWMGGPYEQNNDRVTRVRTQFHQSDPFNNYGVDYQWGRQGGSDYGFLAPFITHRFGQKLTLNLSSSFLSYQGSQYQHIFTFNYDLTPQRGFSGRLVSQNGGTGGYLAYRRSGYGGTEMWLIVGDPNAPKFQTRIAAKVVYPISL